MVKTNTMKKLLLVLLLFSLTVSCSKDEDEKVDTSTFTGLYNDTVWLYEAPDRPVSFSDETESNSNYVRIIDNELSFAYIRERFSPTNDALNECERNIDVLAEGDLDEFGDAWVFEVNTPEMLIAVARSSSLNQQSGEFDYEAIKYTVQDNILRISDASGDTEFNIDEVVFEEYFTTYYTNGVEDFKSYWLYQKVDLDWKDAILLIDCDDDIGA